MQEKNDANPMDLLFQKKNTIHQRVNPSYTSIRWLARKHLGLTEVQGWEERCNRLGWDFSTPNINESKKTSWNLTLHHERGKHVSLGD